MARHIITVKNNAQGEQWIETVETGIKIAELYDGQFDFFPEAVEGLERPQVEEWRRFINEAEPTKMATYNPTLRKPLPPEDPPPDPAADDVGDPP